MQREPSSWWHLTRRPEVRLVLLVVSFGGVVGFLLIFTLHQAHAADKTNWDWLKALILPAVVAALGTLGGAWFTRERSRETALQAYLDKMSELLIEKRIHREYGRYADTRVTARARTLAVLRQLDRKRKSTILLFLREARLINKQQYTREGRVSYPRVVGLRGADLSGAHLRCAQLVSTDGKEAISLEDADLRGADLRRANLMGADLGGTDLRGADLWDANLMGVNINVSEETGRAADLTGTNLTDANLCGANLRGAKGVNREKLEAQTKFLKDATMPDGSVHA